jgi:3-deoxy-D-manno-octulosonic acid (KDO) 8-phosphate synthase
MMQTPAFLVRQTNFIQNVCKQGIPVNIKKELLVLVRLALSYEDL